MAFQGTDLHRSCGLCDLSVPGAQRYPGASVEACEHHRLGRQLPACAGDARLLRGIVCDCCWTASAVPPVRQAVFDKSGAVS